MLIKKLEISHSYNQDCRTLRSQLFIAHVVPELTVASLPLPTLYQVINCIELRFDDPFLYSYMQQRILDFYLGSVHFLISVFGHRCLAKRHKLHAQPETPFGTFQTAQNGPRWDVSNIRDSIRKLVC